MVCDMRLEGKVAIVTGGARGQGEAEARLFAREGAKVVIGDVLDDLGAKVADEIVQAGGDALYLHLDVSKEEDWQRAVETTVSRYGKLNVLVNNAAIIRKGWVEETTTQDWDAVLDVNAKGVLLGTKTAIPEMRKAGGGSIINIGSSAALVGDIYSAAYAASKGATRQLTKGTALQYGKEGIRANAIHPGPVDTPMRREALPGAADDEADKDRTVLGRVGTPDEIAYGALFLASDESSFVTGIDLPIDGGLTAQ